MEILIGIIIGAAVIGLGLYFKRQFIAWLDARMRKHIAVEVVPLIAQVKTDVSRIEENTLAKPTEITDNLRVTQPEDVGSEPPPFWNDKQQIKAAIANIIGSPNDPENEEDLSHLSPHEKWQVLDARVLDLEDAPPDELNAAGTQPGFSR